MVSERSAESYVRVETTPFPSVLVNGCNVAEYAVASQRSDPSPDLESELRAPCELYSSVTAKPEG